MGRIHAESDDTADSGHAAPDQAVADKFAFGPPPRSCGIMVMFVDSANAAGSHASASSQPTSTRI